MGGASWQLAVCKTRCHSDVLLFSCALLQQVLPLTRSFSWSLATSKGCEVSNNDIHAFKSICGHLADKESTFHSSTTVLCKLVVMCKVEL